MLAEQFVIEEDTITADTSFSEDLGADSLDIVELAMAVEEEFDIPEMNEDDLPSLATVGDLVRYISNIID
jgi:acyl carrier protein